LRVVVTLGSGKSRISFPERSFTSALPFAAKGSGQMTKYKWAKISSIFALIYGLFLLFQAIWPGWAIVQSGESLNIAKIIGGVVLVGWAVVFFKLKG